MWKGNERTGGTAREEAKKRGRGQKKYGPITKKNKCRLPGCSYHGGDVRHHLKTHVNKGKVEEENLDALVKVFRHGNRKCGPVARPTKKKTHSATRFKTWCPVSGCITIISYLYRHLPNVHGVKKNTVQYRIYRKSARRYSGMEEMEMLVSKKTETKVSAKDKSKKKKKKKKKWRVWRRWKINMLRRARWRV